ncbi:MAG TPA: substrate-binding domain-containing protein [Polyangiaceae bacterium]|nr:substrate-binding domain-containing protein [Polyangiaceae bacterium]
MSLTAPGGRIRTARVGVVLDAFDSTYQTELVRGLATACRARRLELVVFPGGILGGKQLAAPQRNAIYRFVTPSGPVDGLVLLGSTIVRDRAEVQRWCEQLRPLPLCSIGLELSGVPSLLPDNQNSVRAMVRHLVEKHGQRRLAFVSGPSGNQESNERLAAFRAELDALGLDGSSAPMVEGDFLVASGREAARELLARYPNALDGIVCANDYMAMGVLDVLCTRSSALERRMPVVGFDNVSEASFTVPPLTTIQQPLRRLAEAAIACILAQLEGEPCAPLSRLETQPRIRRSCGCKEPTALRSTSMRARSRAEPFDLSMKRRAAQIGAELQRVAEGLFVGMAGWDQQLIESCIEQARGIPGDLFLHAVDRILGTLVEQRAEVWRFQGVLSALRVAALDAMSNEPRQCLEAEELFHAARAMTSAAAVRAQARDHSEAEDVHRVLNRMGTRLSACSDLPSLRAALDETLPGFALRRAFLLTLVSPLADGAARARLCYGLGVDLDAAEASATFEAHELLPAAVWERARRNALVSNWVVLPLFSRDVVLGFAVLELIGQNGADYEALRIHLSSALANALRALDVVLPSLAPATQRSFGR